MRDYHSFSGKAIQVKQTPHACADFQDSKSSSWKAVEHMSIQRKAGISEKSLKWGKEKPIPNRPEIKHPADVVIGRINNGCLGAPYLIMSLDWKSKVQTWIIKQREAIRWCHTFQKLCLIVSWAVKCFCGVDVQSFLPLMPRLAPDARHSPGRAENGSMLPVAGVFLVPKHCGPSF